MILFYKWVWIAILVALAIVPRSIRADEPQQSVVKIFSSRSRPNYYRPWEVTAPTESTGSGVLIEGGRILTAAHVVAYSQRILVQPYESAHKLDAEIEFIAQDCDLATLKLNDPKDLEGLKPLPLTDTLPELRTKVSVLGYPIGGNSLSVTEGIVSRIEFGRYYFMTSALRLQVDAAINSGNSGGPALANNSIIGIVFSRIQEGEKIGFLIPTEVIRHFLDDCQSDGKYDGFPTLDIAQSTPENPTLRDYLKLDEAMSGVVVVEVRDRGLSSILKPWDVITKCDGISIDNAGMVRLENNVLVQWMYLLSRLAPNATVELSVWRDGETMQLKTPTVTERKLIIKKMSGVRPTYFIYGGLVFSPATQNLLNDLTEKWFHSLAWKGSHLISSLMKPPEYEGDELVIVACPILPHKLNKGYAALPFSVVTKVNNQPVKNLRQMIQLIKDSKDEFIIFQFDEYVENIVFRRGEVDKATSEITRDNGIPAVCSPDLKEVWP